MSDARWADMVGAYVLDALDAEDRALFDARLARDEELQRLVDGARQSTLRLAESLPDVTPPPELRARVLERVATSGVRPVHPGVSAERERDPDIGGARRMRGAVPWMLLAASVAGLLWMANENAELDRRSGQLTAQLDSVRASLGSAQVVLARFDSLALALSGPDVQFSTLSGDVEPVLRLVWNRERQLLLVTAQNLPPAAPGRTFQLWGIRGDEPPVSLGTFDTDASGAALVMLDAGATQDYDVSAITDEPAGGSPQPTTTPFLVGPWTGA